MMAPGTSSTAACNSYLFTQIGPNATDVHSPWRSHLYSWAGESWDRGTLVYTGEIMVISYTIYLYTSVVDVHHYLIGLFRFKSELMIGLRIVSESKEPLFSWGGREFTWIVREPWQAFLIAEWQLGSQIINCETVKGRICTHVTS